MSEHKNNHVHSEHTNNHVHGGPAVLDIGEDVGALLIYCHPQLRGQQIDVSPRERLWERTHTDVLKRQVNANEPVFAALFLALNAGVYVIWNHDNRPIGEVTVNGGQVSELDWRQVLPQILLGSRATSITDGPEISSI